MSNPTGKGAGSPNSVIDCRWMNSQEPVCGLSELDGRSPK